MSQIQEKKRIRVSVEIHASRDKIWEALTGDASFRDWGAAFMPGSYYEGDWSEGSLMRFLGPDDRGELGGMITRVLEHRPGEGIRCEHIGVIANGQDVYEGPDYDTWIPSIETYRLEEIPGGYRLQVESDIPESYFEYFSGAWPKALARLKELAEA